MTYQAPAQEFSTGEQSIFSTTIALVGRVLKAVGGVFKSIGQSYCKAALASSRMQMARMLQEKSDDELAQMGIKRDQIARLVFGDLYHI